MKTSMKMRLLGDLAPTAPLATPVVLLSTASAPAVGRNLRKSTSRLRLFGLAAILGLGVLATTLQAGQRPITDFTSRQGTYCLKIGDCANSSYGGSDCDLFVPPQPNGAGWLDPATLYFVLADYAGLADAVVGGAFGTTLDGSITEVPLADGRARVSVVLHTRNAFIWASDLHTGFPGDLVFGHRLDEVLAGAPPALGETVLKLTFKNTAPGAPLPDLMQLNFCPGPGQEREVYSFVARADGLLPDGQPGRLEVIQTGLLGVSGIANEGSAVADAFPAEKVIIRATGR